MSTDARELYLRWINEVWAGSLAAGELVTDTFVGHWPDRRVSGPVELQSTIDETRAAFDDLSFAIEEGPFVDGEIVTGRWRGRGTDSDGTAAEFVGHDILRLSGTEFCEYWVVSTAVPAEG